MKKKLPAIITAALILGALGFFTQRERIGNGSITDRAPVTPEDLIWRMSDAAREGDVKAYLDCFDGDLRQRLTKTAADMGEAQFSQYLKRLNEEITGIALSDLEQKEARSASLRVEFVSRGRSESQTHRFKLVDGAWKIEGVDAAENVKTLIPQGTEVTGK
jgi:hypothetical protein